MTQYLKLYGAQLVERGYSVVPIPVGTKGPRMAGWQDVRATVADVKKWAGNGYADAGVGVLARNTPAIDLDFEDQTVVDALMPTIQGLFPEMPPMRVGRAPKTMFVCRTDEPFTKVQSAKYQDTLFGATFQVEILGDGQQFVAFHTHPDTGKPYTWPGAALFDLEWQSLPVLTLGMAQQIVAAFEAIAAERVAAGEWEQVEKGGGGRQRKTQDVEDDWYIEPALDLTEQQVREAVFKLDPGMSRSGGWLTVSMGLHHQSRGADWALALLIDWSSTAPNFVSADDIEKDWRGYTLKEGGVTFRSVMSMVAEVEKLEKYQAAAEWVAEIGKAPRDFELVEKVCPAIRKDSRLTDVEVEKLAAAVKERLHALGTKLPIDKCRKLVAPKKEVVRYGGVPDWLKPWVFVTQQDKFYRMDSDEWLSLLGFNAKFNREVPSGPDGEQPPASWEALNQHQIPVVTRGAYLPWAGPLFDMEGTACVNLYKPSSVPVAADTYTEADQAAIERVLAHVDLLTDGRQEVSGHLLAWLAHNVQNPGVKIRHSPLIKGVEGDGKSLLGALMAGVMGRSNVCEIAPKVIATDFNGWAEGSCVGVLEEIRITGHNRYDVLNALKPLVTNDVVAVHRKGVDQYQTVNTTNYIAFTNHADALPLDDSDRRWWVLFTPFTTKEQLIARVGGDARGYFDALHEAIQDHRAALRKFFLEYPIPAGFDRNMRAPETAEKASMVAAGVSDEVRLAQEVIETGALGVCQGAVSSADLTRAMRNWSGGGLEIQTTAVNKLMLRLGYSQFPGTVKWRGVNRRVWVPSLKGAVAAEIRTLLEGTVTDEFADFCGEAEKGTD